MEISSKVKYALLALLKLADHHPQGEFLQIEQIAADDKIPNRYLAQLLMMLRRSGLVRSQRGAKGGYLLARDPRQITVFEVLTSLEGSLLQELSCQTQPQTVASFAVDEVWREANMAASAIFQRYTLQDLCELRNRSQQSNPMFYI